jgi:hypothetical protein
MKSQVQHELMQLVNGSTKGKTKLASMIKRMQDQDQQNDAKQSLNNSIIIENNKASDDSITKTASNISLSTKNDKFSSLVCPQPFNSRPIKKTFSMQHPVSYLSVNLINKGSSKEHINNVGLLKHSISFTAKQENAPKGKIIY